MKKYKMWKQIDFVEGIEAKRYLISQNGEIKSVISNKIISTYISNCGYEYVTLYCNGYHKNIEVHRLIAIAFIPNKDNKLEVNHKDGDRLHNTITNLEWVTRSENQQDQRKRNKTAYTVNYCPNCRKIISKGAKQCKFCQAISYYKVNRPSKEELELKIQEYNGNFTKLGKYYNVSDNAVRKWCKSYNMSTKSKDYKKVTDK